MFQYVHYPVGSLSYQACNVPTVCRDDSIVHLWCWVELFPFWHFVGWFFALVSLLDLQQQCFAMRMITVCPGESRLTWTQLTLLRSRCCLVMFDIWMVSISGSGWGTDVNLYGETTSTFRKFFPSVEHQHHWELGNCLIMWLLPYIQKWWLHLDGLCLSSQSVLQPSTVVVNPLNWVCSLWRSQGQMEWRSGLQQGQRHLLLLIGSIAYSKIQTCRLSALLLSKRGRILLNLGLMLSSSYSMQLGHCKLCKKVWFSFCFLDCIAFIQASVDKLKISQFFPEVSL